MADSTVTPSMERKQIVEKNGPLCNRTDITRDCHMKISGRGSAVSKKLSPE